MPAHRANAAIVAIDASAAKVTGDERGIGMGLGERGRAPASCTRTPARAMSPVERIVPLVEAAGEEAAKNALEVDVHVVGQFIAPLELAQAIIGTVLRDREVPVLGSLACPAAVGSVGHADGAA